MKSQPRSMLAPAMFILCTIAVLAPPRDARAFCGFYVGSAGATLYNHASQVAMVRSGDRTVISLMNDYDGPLDRFALVVPVPVVLQKGQVHIGDRELFKKLDEYSAPRLVEYHDENPCEFIRPLAEAASAGAMATMSATSVNQERAKALGVSIEAEYAVGEYDIVILSAKESDGLETWLAENGYQVPSGASRALEPYIRQQMKFFVAKVDLKAQKRTGLTYLRPLQFAFSSPKFMLPIRLGMINAQGPQDLVIYMLTREGCVETTNYRTVKLPTGEEIPGYVREEFGDFYKAMFNHQVRQADMRAVFTEYAWDMGWCDPCAAPPLTRDELQQLGVFWLDEYSGPQGYRPLIMPGPANEWAPVRITRLHVRYSADTFPEDLMFQETEDKENFQARYVLQIPWEGSPDACPAAREYFDRVRIRRFKEAQELADLTGWDVDALLKRVGLPQNPNPSPWWQHIWE
ncbi:MAG: DUF2330 domain-containing protein [Candidatus Binataceae bacterium]